MEIVEWVETMLGMYPSEGQKEILRIIAGNDPFDWGVQYQQFVIAVGQGGGKNKYIIAPATGYTAYKIAKMKDPHLYFSRFYTNSVDKSAKFELTNSSMVTERQARNVHFENMKQIINRCKSKEGDNWFTRYSGMDLRQSIGDIQSKTIVIPTKRGHGDIVLHSFDSTPTAVEGLSIIWGIVDEPSRANTAVKYQDALNLWKVITGNINTRWGKRVGKQIAFSYLNNSEYDLTYTLLLQAEEEKKYSDNPVMFACNRTTFEMNPNIAKTDESVQNDYRFDPQDARARYEGIKGLAKESFFQPHPEKIRECFTKRTESPVGYSQGTTKRAVADPATGIIKESLFRRLNINKIVGDNRIRCMFFDPAEKYDSFVLMCGYTETMDEMKDEIFVNNQRELIVTNKKPIIDIILVWLPTENIIVDYLNVGDVIGMLLDKYPNMRSANSDKYNSA